MVIPVDFKSLPQRAQDLYFEVVGKFNPNAAALVELQRAGVSKMRLAALYPFEFADGEERIALFFQGVQWHILEEAFAKVSVASATFYSFLDLCESVSTHECNPAVIWAKTYLEFRQSETHERLVENLVSCGPATEALAPRRDSLEALFDCWWLLEHWALISEPVSMRWTNQHRSKLAELLEAMEELILAHTAATG